MPMRPEELKDEDYKSIVSQALTAAVDGLNNHTKVFDAVLPQDAAIQYNETTSHVVAMIDNVKAKFNEDRNLMPHENSIINKALIEYIQKVEQAQTHMFHMARDLTELAPFKDYVEKVHVTHMKFNHEVALDEASKLSLRQRPAPASGFRPQ